MEDKLLQIVRWLSELTQTDKKVNKNILYENSKNNENWHSRILRMLLEYHEGINYSIMDSFIDLLNDLLKKKNCLSIKKVNEYTDPPKVECYNEWEHIDALVRINNDALIIENKINWAVDQDAQIDRYIETINQNPMVDGDNIYVIYLTSDGNKLVSDYSFTDKGKELIGKNHFIPLNYRNDILPWLKDKVLPNVNREDSLLYSSILLYIDYLDNMFRKENNNQITNEILNQMKMNEIKIECLEDYFKLLDGATELVNQLSMIKGNKIKELAEKCIVTPLKAFLENNEKQLELSKWEFNLGYFNIEIKHQLWKKCYIHIGIWQYKVYGGIAYNNPNNPLPMETLDKIKEKFDKWKGDGSEPIWNYFDKENKDYYSLDAWKKIENGTFEKCIEEFIGNLYGKIKEFNNYL